MKREPRSQRKIHSATVTVLLSTDLSTEEEVLALRVAGIPVDDTGAVACGYLFVRCRRQPGRPNIFRWFSSDPA